MKSPMRLIAFACLFLGVPAVTSASSDLVRTYCSGCHHESVAGHFDRISDVRKTPEGWTMTLFRMHQVHGLNLPEGERDQIVRHLSDTQGLAPSESQAGRFALERRPNVKDIDLDPETNVMCGRCHSIARSALQRRDEAEWLKLAHMHLGQWPSLEYQASSRDRPWWSIASGKMPAQLAARWGYSSDAWTRWSAETHRSLEGRWIFTSHATGGRDYYGTMTVTRDDKGEYHAEYALQDSSGESVKGTSHAVVYTGYEWRGTADFSGLTLREVYAASEDGNRITGRWFDANHPEIGGDTVAVRDTSSAEILAMQPRALKVGYAGPMTLIGPGMEQLPVATFGDGVSVGRVTRSPGVLTVDIRVESGASVGAHPVRAGNVATTIPVYRHLDAVTVTPAFAIARLGGGKTPPVVAQFEALGSTRMEDGSLMSLGPVFSNWVTEPYDDEARRTDDSKFAGTIDGSGQFHPAGAGPNKQREFSGNNVGNLKVVARPIDNTDLRGDAHLIVTVQRWNNTPIY